MLKASRSFTKTISVISAITLQRGEEEEGEEGEEEIYFRPWAVALVASVIGSASAVFDPTSKTNVVTYWGQGPNQDRLIETCKISGEKERR